MPGLIPDINFQPYVQPNQDLPIRDIQEYQKEQRDKYAQALNLKNTAADALHNNKNVLDIDRPQYTADANAIHENLGTLGGSVGNYEDNVGKAQHLAREAQAKIEYYGERNKDYNENLKKIAEDKNYGPAGNTEHGNVLTYINMGGQGKIKNVDFVKPVDIIDLAQKTQGAIKEKKWENDPILSSIGGIPVLESITSGTYSKKRIEDLVKLRNENDPELNQYNQQEAFSKAVNRKTGEWLGIPQKDIDQQTIDYLNANNLPHTHQNIVNFQYQHGLELKKQHDLDVMTKAVETGLVDSRSVQDKNVPEGYGGGNSQRVFKSPAGTNVVNTPTVGGGPISDNIHYGEGVSFDATNVKLAGIKYFNAAKGTEGKSAEQEEFSSGHVAPMNVATKDLKGHFPEFTNSQGNTVAAKDFSIKKGQPLNETALTAFVKATIDNVKQKYSDEADIQREVQKRVDDAVKPDLIAEGKLAPPNWTREDQRKSVYLSWSTIKDHVFAKNKYKGVDRKPFDELEQSVPQKADISSLYKQLTGKEPSYLDAGGHPVSEPTAPSSGAFDYSKIIQ